MLNDKIDFNQVNNFDRYVLSPGPGLPSEAGDLLKFIKLVEGKPLLGVCLGLQAIVEIYGGRLFNQTKVKHGVHESCLLETNTKLFQNLPKKINVGLYHSWAADEKYLPIELKIVAKSEYDIIMAIEHKDLPIVAVQFHPESVMTEYGKEMIRNFLTLY